MWLAGVRVTSGDNVAGRDETRGARDELNFHHLILADVS